LDLFAEEAMKRFHYIHVKDAITALSLSNLYFLPAWRYALYSLDPHGYHLEEPSMWRNSIGLMLDVLLLAALLWVSYTFARRLRQERLLALGRWVFLFAVVVSLDGVRGQFPDHLTARALIAVVGKPSFIALIVGISFLSVFTLARHSRRVISGARMIVLILSPFALMTFSQAAWSLMKSRPANAAAKIKSAADAGNKTRPATRVLWIIFDEFDYRVAFAARPSSVELPEFDRLRAESIMATNAYPPAIVTMLSIPALVTGRLVTEARASNYNELMIKFDGASERVGWSTQPNVFSRTREIGGAAAVVGWYHPYCRVIGGDLTRCLFTGLVYENELDVRNQSIPQSMLKHFRIAGLTAPMVHYVLPESLKSDLKFDLKFDHKSDKWKVAYIESMKRIAQEGAAAATDSAISLIMIHFPAPHFPYVYDRRKDDITFEGGVNYFDNLEFVDRTFRDLRRVMERAGWWDDTVVLVSSDHWWKFYQWQGIQPLTEEEKSATSEVIDYRVPFMLKLKRQRENVIYNPPFNTVLSQDLILALLRGELSTPSDVTAWLDRHRSIGKSPYY
jgi:hypothetical protein